MKIKVPPEAREDLLQFLRRADCQVAVEAEDTVVVDVPAALGEEQARMEVDLYLKAWQASRPEIEANLLDPQSRVADEASGAE
jgi:hypothetical protein